MMDIEDIKQITGNLLWYVESVPGAVDPCVVLSSITLLSGGRYIFTEDRYWNSIKNLQDSCEMRQDWLSCFKKRQEKEYTRPKYFKK